MKAIDFQMFYAELMGNTAIGEPYIKERGVFNSLEEFLPYRTNGWQARIAINEAADRELRSREVVKCLSCGWEGIRAECPHDAWPNGAFSCECPKCTMSIPAAFIRAKSTINAE